MAVKAAIAPAKVAEINFGDLGMYVAGGGIPEGKYALMHQVVYEPETDKYKPTVKRIGVLLSAYPLEGGEPKTKFLGMGSAHESFVPNPDTGKGLVPKEGGKGSVTISQSCNWALYLKSLYDAGLPPGMFTNDVSVIDGIWAHLVNEPEPADRQTFRSRQTATAEVAQEEKPRQPGTYPKVLVLLEGGLPWEGGGGIPEAKAEKPNGKATAAAPAKAAPKAPARPAPVAPTSGPTEEELMDLALQGVSSVLEKNPDGVARLMLQTGTFRKAKELSDDATASAVIDLVFKDDNRLAALLADVGYQVNKANKIVVLES